MKLEIRYNRATITSAGVRFDQFPNQLRADLIVTINELAQEAMALAAARVPRRTGRLASELQIVNRNEPDVVSSTVNFDLGAESSDFAKAGALEYGSTGKRFSIKTYTRGGDTVFGRLVEPYEAIVKAYDRAGNIVERAFMRPILAEMQPRALAAINAVAERAIARTNDD